MATEKFPVTVSKEAKSVKGSKQIELFAGDVRKDGSARGFNISQQASLDAARKYLPKLNLTKVGFTIKVRARTEGSAEEQLRKESPAKTSTPKPAAPPKAETVGEGDDEIDPSGPGPERKSGTGWG